MRIDVRSHALALTPVVRDQIERRLFIALRSFSRHIDEISISIRDVNGPRGGKDLLGQVIVRLRRGSPIVVRARDESLRKLAAQLATAVRPAVKSRIRRRRTRSIGLARRSQRSLAAAPQSDSQLGERMEDRALELAN